MTSSTLFQNTFALRRPGIVNFNDIIKIVTIFIKKSLKTQTKVEIMYQNAIYVYLYFLI